MDEIVYWLKGADKQNFGDFLSEYFFGRLFVPLPSRFHRVHVIGSVIDDHYISLAKSHRDSYELKEDLVSFWGCGLREDRPPSAEIKSKSNFLAVRGVLTRDLLELPNETPMGDPGLLLPFIFPAPKDCNNLNVLVPHILDGRNDDDLISITGCDQVLRPEVENSIESLENFFGTLLKAKFVLCGSLHAAIIRLAYGLPFGYWDSGSIDIPFKWHDFSSSVGIETKFHKSILGAHEYWSDSLQGGIKFPSLVKLLLASPYPVYPSVLFKAEEFDRGFGLHGSYYSDDLFVGYWSKEADFYNALIDRTKKTQIFADSANECARLAEAQVAQANERARLAEAQVAQANERAHALWQQVNAVLNSHSWKITKPLREAGRFSRWFMPRSKAWLTFAPYSRPRRISRNALVWAVNKVSANPRLKAWAITLLNKFPRLKQRLKNIELTQSGINIHGHGHERLAQTTANLSPRAQQIYTDLKTAMEKHNNEEV